MAAMVATGSRLSAEGSRLFRIRKTCLKMLQKRGYVVDEEQLDMTKETFIQTWGENPTRDAMTILAEKADNETGFAGVRAYTATKSNGVTNKKRFLSDGVPGVFFTPEEAALKRAKSIVKRKFAGVGK